MSKKLKLEDIRLASFVTVNHAERSLKGGGDSTNRNCPTAYACPSEYPVCTHPYYC